MTVDEVRSDIVITVSQKKQRLKALTCPTVTSNNITEHNFDDILIT